VKQTPVSLRSSVSTASPSPLPGCQSAQGPCTRPSLLLPSQAPGQWPAGGRSKAKPSKARRAARDGRAHRRSGEAHKRMYSSSVRLSVGVGAALSPSLPFRPLDSALLCPAFRIESIRSKSSRLTGREGQHSNLWPTGARGQGASLRLACRRFAGKCPRIRSNSTSEEDGQRRGQGAEPP
jgi:hypothetical protein